MNKTELKQMIDTCYDQAETTSKNYIEILETATCMMLGWLLSDQNLFDEFMELEAKKRNEIKALLYPELH